MRRTLLFVIAVTVIITNSLSAEDENINLLFLSSYAATLPWSISIQEGIDEIKTVSGIPVTLYHEYLDNMRLVDSFTVDEWSWYLTKKYRDVGIDAVIIDADPYTDLFRNLKNYLPGVPKIMRNQAEDIEPAEDLYLFPNNIKKSAADTFEIALRQNPDAQHIYIVDGDIPTTSILLEQLIELSGKHGFEPVIKHNFSAEKLFSEIGNLPKDSIIFYTLIRKDADGVQYIPRDFLTSMCKIANAPVYVFWSSLMDSGAVGGRVLDAEAAGKALFRSAINLVKEGSFRDENSDLEYFFDIKAMRRHSIPRRYIPEGASLINTFSEYVKLHMETILGVLIMVSISLGLLIILLIRLKLLNRVLNKTNGNLNQAIEEKHLLMREMYHRIKNDLLILSSLCSLQIDNETDAKVIDSLNDIRSRIEVLSTIHENLSVVPDIHEISSAEYFVKLLNQLNFSLNLRSDRVKMRTDISEISMNSQQVIACGLILNELISNIFKYAFPDDEGGDIYVKISSENSSVFLYISDTGVGFKTDFNESSGFGLEIIREMVRSLNGSINYHFNNGSVFSIVFPLE